MSTVPVVICDIGGHAITQHTTSPTINNLSYDVFLGTDWLKSTNPVIDWVACFLELTVGAKLHTIIALLVNSVANVALSSLKKVLAEVNHGCPAWFGLLHPHSLLDTKGMLAAFGGGDSTRGSIGTVIPHMLGVDMQ